MTGWAELLAAATLGTDRRPAADPDELLAAAAAHCPYRRAGQAPATALPAPAVAPPDPGPVVPAAATNRLAGMLDRAGVGGSRPPDQAELLGEWLRLAVARQWRVPPDLLPALLHVGRKHPPLWSLLVATGGERAVWLAAQREEWHYLTAGAGAGADPAVWSEGSTGSRVEYLTAARRRDPAAARELLAGQWRDLPAGERAKLLDTFVHGLGPSDEEFLESALDDRGKQVREVAASLLARLPESRCGVRMAERARACLSIGPKRVTVTPPSECDGGMRRDGIAVKPVNNFEPRAWWLSEIIARTPLSTWDRSLAAATFTAGWADAVRDGLVRAAAAQRDAAWAEALLDQLVAAAGKGPRRIDRQWADALGTALPPAALLPRAEQLLRGDTSGMVWVDQILAHCPGPWPLSVGDALIGGIVALLGSRQAHVLHPLCRLAGLRLPPELADRAAQVAQTHAGADDDNGWLLHRLADILHFRLEMTKELTCPQ